LVQLELLQEILQVVVHPALPREGITGALTR